MKLKLTQITILAALVFLAGCNTFMPEHEALSIERRNLARELAKQKAINRAKADIQRMEQELEEERMKYYE